MPTTGYAAAVDTSDVVMSYTAETTWGTAATTSYQDIRCDSEGFGSTQSGNRPNEMDASGQAAAEVTTKVESNGSLNFSVSAGTHNALVAASIGGTFSAALTISDTTISATATGFADSNDGLAGIAVGQMVSISGYTTASLNTFYRVDNVAAGFIGTTPAPAITAGAGETVTISGSMCRNGTVFQSYTVQKKLASALYLLYAGSWPTGGSLDVGVGDYLKGTLSFLNKSEATATSDAGSHTAAPTGLVIESVNGITSILRNGAAISGHTQKIGVKWTKEGSRAQFAMGSSAAIGMGKGKLNVTASYTQYFSTFALYTEAVNEIPGPLSFQALDSAGNGYIITICNAKLKRPKIVAGGPNQDVTAEFEIVGQPGDATLYGGRTIQIDYFA